MRIWQRGASFTPTSLATIYTTDRWACYRPAFAAGLLASRQSASGLAGLPYALRVERSSGNAGTTAMQANQSVESITCYEMQGKTVTLSFYARCGSAFSATSSVLTSSIVTGTGTDESLANTGYAGQATNDQANTISTSWQRFTHTYSIPSTVNEITTKFSYLPTGTSAGNDWYEITGVQLEAGPVATPFEQRPIGMEYDLCRRYFEAITVVNPSASGSLIWQFYPKLGTVTVTSTARTSSNSWTGDLSLGQSGIFYTGAGSTTEASDGTAVLYGNSVVIRTPTAIATFNRISVSISCEL